MKVFWTNLRQAFCGTGFCLAVLGTVLALFSGCFSTLLSALRSVDGNLPMDAYYWLFRQAASSEALELILPITAALPFTASFYDDLHSGFIKASLPRTGYRKYITGKLSACFWSGGLAPVTGVLCFGILTGIVILPRTAYLTISWEEISRVWTNCVLLFFSGAFWSLVGMTGAALTNSKYMAYTSPFILFYVLVILSERYFKKPIFLNPKTWLTTVSSLWVVCLLTALTGFVFLRYAGRRLRNL